MKYVILHDIRSAHNVGAIFRTADGAGVKKIFLTGYTPAPIDRFGRPVAEIIKTSLGASNSVAWEVATNPVEVIKQLQAAGVLVVAVEQSETAESLYNFEEPTEVAYIFGNEVLGVPSELRALADATLEIPMAGFKESLNVSVSAGIVLFHHQS